MSDDPVESPKSSVTRNLESVHARIDVCRVCEGKVSGFLKPSTLHRGDPGKVMIIGQGPGKTELQSGNAFSGQSGKTLNQWLIACGADPRQPRRGIYLTSIIKCCTDGGGKAVSLMADNCFSFLAEQIAAIQPAVLITLGKIAYENLRFFSLSYDSALCSPKHSRDYLLISTFGFDFWQLTWPHPSGLNRWLNVPENKRRLQNSFDFVREVLKS
jgi:uracil-DNA glycosylase family 4